MSGRGLPARHKISKKAGMRNKSVREMSAKGKDAAEGAKKITKNSNTGS